MIDGPTPAKPFAIPNRFQARLAWAITGLFLLRVLWISSTISRLHSDWMLYVADDFFYYAKVAKEIAAGHGSTFNGITPTNGYHPLWLLTVLAVFLAHIPMSLFVEGTCFLATVVTFLLAFRILREGSPIFATLAAAYVALYALHLFTAAMEVTLAIPLMLAVLYLVLQGGYTPGRSLVLGLVTCLMILARLDTAIFAVLLFGCLAFEERLSRRSLAGFSVGLLPLLGYFALNREIFGVWMPISGMAKQLKTDHGFTSSALHSVLSDHKVLMNAAPSLVALLALPFLWRELPRVKRAVAFAALTFPPLHLLLLSYLSDWPVWHWYFYGLRVSLCIAVMVFLSAPRLRSALDSGVVWVLLAAVVGTYALASRWNYGYVTIIQTAQELKDWSATHPGIYAMGDRSGAVGYLVDQPFVQTEGLMMDRAFLDQLRVQTPLRTVLARYHVRYYVASSVTSYEGCFHAEEPAQAGVHAPHLRGEFCEAPVARWQHNEVETLVFDLADGR